MSFIHSMLVYPAPYVKHPEIGHVHVTDKIFPYLEPKKLTLNELADYYKATYIVLAKDFDGYLEWREEQFWSEFLARNLKNKNY